MQWHGLLYGSIAKSLCKGAREAENDRAGQREIERHIGEQGKIESRNKRDRRRNKREGEEQGR